ncbi:uncharacterized protein LOC108202539 [Daucus carota subsp. sativus]|uniref:uncharacterized protein LOC108202539 n=1 Tax=Daucus carota subsp. sativus TaxID=79200 RepID=UPI0007EFDD08|nr:PREDICTED: uncharacterized protein LOC108202539 [Daucus carota subsp. sativus]
MTSTSQPTAASSEPLTLDLDSEHKAGYEEFIESLIKEFWDCPVAKYLTSLDEVGFDEELKPKIEKCFPLMFVGTAASLEGEATDMKTVYRTHSPAELKDKNWVFQVRLKHGGRNLEILIKKNNLYLVAYKGKFNTKKDGTEQDENWIVLDGKNHNEVAESISKFLTPNSLKKVTLGTSYTALFGKSGPSFYDSARESDLYENLKKKLEKFKGLAEREEERNIKYAKTKLGEIKSKIERQQEENSEGSERLMGGYESLEENEDFKRVNRLLNMVPKDITREHVEELEGIANEAERDFLNHLKKPQADHIPAGKLIEKLQKKNENYNQQGQVPNEAEASENQRNPFSKEWPILWGKMFKKRVVILGSLAAGKKDTIDWAKRTEKYTLEDWKEELQALIKLTRMLKKKFGIDGTPETNPTDDKIWEVFFSEKAKLKKQYEAVNKEDQAKFYKELKEMSDVLKYMMQSVRADAEIIEVKDRLAKVKLNRLAFTEAVEYLTKSSFGENEGETASHIIKLAIMICEAARFPDIKKHVANNYHKTTHEDTASLSEECITSVYRWSHRSALMQRGGVYAGEIILLGEDPAVIKEMDKNKVSKE